jgi:hypothetical protein
VIASIGHVSSHVLQRMQISGSIRCWRMTSTVVVSAIAQGVLSSIAKVRGARMPLAIARGIPS